MWYSHVWYPTHTCQDLWDLMRGNGPERRLSRHTLWAVCFFRACLSIAHPSLPDNPQPSCFTAWRHLTVGGPGARGSSVLQVWRQYASRGAWAPAGPPAGAASRSRGCRPQRTRGTRMRARPARRGCSSVGRGLHGVTLACILLSFHINSSVSKRSDHVTR